MISTLESMASEFVEYEAHLGHALDAPMRRWLLLRQITWDTRHGIVDGVEIDLRHELLRPGEWDQIHFFGGTDHLFDGPHLIFPWSREDWGYLPRRAARPQTVRHGDRIRIAKVTRRPFSGAELSHPADREYRAAHLVIERQGQRRRIVPDPLQFWPPMSLSKPRLWGAPTFDRIAARVCDALGVADLASFSLITETLTLTEAAFDAATSARDDWRRLQGEIVKLGKADGESANLWLRSLVDQAVALGYLAAQSEAERYVEPRARRDLGRLEASGEGGRRSGATRRRRALTWKLHATRLIQEILGEPGPHKREALVFEVQNRWDLAGVKAPGDRSLWGLLKELSDSAVIDVEGL